jgi:hypothetical protein
MPLFYNPAGDNIFPVSELHGFNGDTITSGYRGSKEVFIDKPAKAEVMIRFTSDNPALVSLPDSVIIPVGGTSASPAVQTQPIPGPIPPVTVNIHALYADKSLTTSVTIVPPQVVDLTLSPDTVTTGNGSTATVRLDRPSLAGDVVVDLGCTTGFASVPPHVTIPVTTRPRTLRSPRRRSRFLSNLRALGSWRLMPEVSRPPS